jgi:hypothetical protein
MKKEMKKEKKKIESLDVRKKKWMNKERFYGKYVWIELQRKKEKKREEK